MEAMTFACRFLFVSSVFNIFAGVSSTIIRTPVDVIVLQGEYFRLNCSSNSTNPVRSVKWWYTAEKSSPVIVYGNGGITSQFSSTFTYDSSSSGQVDLIASSATLNDCGVYTCTDSTEFQHNASVAVIANWLECSTNDTVATCSVFYNGTVGPSAKFLDRNGTQIGNGSLASFTTTNSSGTSKTFVIISSTVASQCVISVSSTDSLLNSSCSYYAALTSAAASQPSPVTTALFPNTTNGPSNESGVTHTTVHHEFTSTSAIAVTTLPSNSSSNKTPIEAIIGGVVGGVAGIAAIVGFICLLTRVKPPAAGPMFINSSQLVGRTPAGHSNPTNELRGYGQYRSYQHLGLSQGFHGNYPHVTYNGNHMIARMTNFYSSAGHRYPYVAKANNYAYLYK